MKLEVDDKVTVVVSIPYAGAAPGAYHATVVEALIGRDFFAARLVSEFIIVHHACTDEGVTWARGWHTPEADALRAAFALDT